MSIDNREVSEVLKDFLDYIDQCRSEYQAAHEAVGMEDRRLQDLLHELEFSKDENEKRAPGQNCSIVDGNEGVRKTKYRGLSW